MRKIMKIISPRAGRLLSLPISFCCMSAALAEPAPPQTQRMEPTPNGIFLTADPASSPQGTEMRKRLSDPQLREGLRAETREQVRSSNPDIAQVLELDETLARDLIEMLTDQQMAHLEYFWSETSGPGAFRSAPDGDRMFFTEQANTESRNKRELEALLGEDRFDRYIAYATTLVQRLQVVHFEKRLELRDKLRADQKDRLMALLRARQEQSFNWARMGSADLMPPFLSALAEERTKALQKRTIAMSERTYREMQEETRLLLEQLPEVLTPRQLEAYTQMEADKLSSQRRHIERMRVSAGMSPELDPAPSGELRAAQRTLAPGKVRLEVSFRANDGEPVAANLLADNGKPAAPFEGTAGLWVEATPALFDDGEAHVLFKFYEERNGKRRALAGALGVGVPKRASSYSVQLGPGGGAGTIVSGSKAYAIMVAARITGVQ